MLSNNASLHIVLAKNSNATSKNHLPCAAGDKEYTTETPDDVNPRYHVFPAVTSSTAISGRSTQPNVVRL